jgi:hypothetical protein
MYENNMIRGTAKRAEKHILPVDILIKRETLFLKPSLNFTTLIDTSFVPN